MSRDLATARLLTIRGYGHTELANPSTCAANYEVSYLLTGKLPPWAPADIHRSSPQSGVYQARNTGCQATERDVCHERFDRGCAVRTRIR
jgi:hypothetical protein